MTRAAVLCLAFTIGPAWADSPIQVRPGLGDVIPRSTFVVGVDGEAVPKRFGVLIQPDGRVALIDPRTRTVVDVLEDGPATSRGSR